MTETNRVEPYSGIVFRSGPVGRRAGLVDGPDVWEVCWLAGQFDDGEPAVRRPVEDFSLTRAQVEVALRYAAEFPEEIEARIELHERETAHYEAVAGD